MSGRLEVKDYGQPGLPEGYDGPTWDTRELQEAFEVKGFAAPFVAVRRKSDGREGVLEFIHSPRVYFDRIGEFRTER